MGIRSSTPRVRLRVFDGWSVDPPEWRGDDGLSPRLPDGRPKVIGRANGYPLIVRVWHSRPRGVEDAAYHPSGVRISIGMA